MMYKNMMAAKIGIWMAKKKGPPGKIRKNTNKLIGRLMNQKTKIYFYICGDGAMLMIG